MVGPVSAGRLSDVPQVKPGIGVQILLRKRLQDLPLDGETAGCKGDQAVKAFEEVHLVPSHVAYAWQVQGDHSD